MKSFDDFCLGFFLDWNLDGVIYWLFEVFVDGVWEDVRKGWFVNGLLGRFFESVENGFGEVLVECCVNWCLFEVFGRWYLEKEKDWYLWFFLGILWIGVLLFIWMIEDGCIYFLFFLELILDFIGFV